MSIGETLKRAMYFAVGAVATGVEAVADAADFLALKGQSVVEKGKEYFKSNVNKDATEEPNVETTVEEDNGENAPV